MVLILFAIIKKVAPTPPPKKEVDMVGIRLYAPIFMAPDVKNRSVAEAEKREELPHAELDQPQKPQTNQTPSIETHDGEEFFEDLITEYRESVLTRRKYRNDVVVRYYKHQPDSTKADTLVDYGFYLHVRPVSDRERYASMGSNVISFGKDFPERDLKLITYLLVTNGIEIKRIRPFKDYDGWKRKAIEIGADKRLVNQRTLTLEQIKALSVPD